MNYSIHSLPRNTAFTTPKALWLGTTRHEAGSWAKVVSAVVRALLMDTRYRENALEMLERVGWTSKEKEVLRRPVKTADGWWVEGNLSSRDMVGHLRKLLETCGYPPEQVELELDESESLPGKPVPPRFFPAEHAPNSSRKTATKSHERWNSQMIPDKKDLPTQIEEFYDGVFSSNDFWEYAAEIYGLDTSPAAKAAQIRQLVQRFIRLDREHWISVPNFKRLSDWDIVKESVVAASLREALGKAPFLPFALLSDDLLSSLPPLHLEGKLLPWLREFTASVAALLVPGIHVANHGVTPQTLTALLVQTPIADDAVIPMSLAVYCHRFPVNRSVEGAFFFLRDNYIRLRLTNHLQMAIRKFLVSFEHFPQPEFVNPSLVAEENSPDHSDENEKLLDDWAAGAF